ncbi:hypothetical protein EAF04_003315 [Stromatinia cepivora]|nr:hypothetical protein EAF04_003315 [Stromatinia cepivora]
MCNRLTWHGQYIRFLTFRNWDRILLHLHLRAIPEWTHLRTQRRKIPLLLSTIYNLTTPQSTLQYALDLQTSISFVIPAMLALISLFALISLITARGIIRHNGTISHFHIKFLFWSSAASAFAAAYALTSTGVVLAVQSRSSAGVNSGIDVEPGKVMFALQWMAWVFTMMAASMSGSITKTFLEGASTRRRRNSSSRSLYERAPNMVRHNVPPYPRDPLPRPPSLISPI